MGRPLEHAPVRRLLPPLPGQREGVATGGHLPRGPPRRQRPAHDPETPRGALLTPPPEGGRRGAGQRQHEAADPRPALHRLQHPLLPRSWSAPPWARRASTSTATAATSSTRPCLEPGRGGAAKRPGRPHRQQGLRERALKNDAAFLENALRYLAGPTTSECTPSCASGAHLRGARRRRRGRHDVTGSDEGWRRGPGQPGYAGRPSCPCPGDDRGAAGEAEVYEPLVERRGPDAAATSMKRRQVIVAPRSRWVSDVN